MSEITLIQAEKKEIHNVSQSETMSSLVKMTLFLSLVQSKIANLYSNLTELETNNAKTNGKAIEALTNKKIADMEEQFKKSQAAKFWSVFGLVLGAILTVCTLGQTAGALAAGTATAGTIAEAAFVTTAFVFSIITPAIESSGCSKGVKQFFNILNIVLTAVLICFGGWQLLKSILQKFGIGVQAAAEGTETAAQISSEAAANAAASTAQNTAQEVIQEASQAATQAENKIKKFFKKLLQSSFLLTGTNISIFMQGITQIIQGEINIEKSQITKHTGQTDKNLELMKSTSEMISKSLDKFSDEYEEALNALRSSSTNATKNYSKALNAMTELLEQSAM